MTEDIDRLAEEARALYREICHGRIVREAALWEQFEAAVIACRSAPRENCQQLTERINELAVAKLLAEDASIAGTIEYEPDLLPDGRKIDFVADRLRDNLYIEVKTVHPRTADTEAAWENYVRRRRHHPQNVHFIVHQDGLGGAIYGNSFASRSRFLEYSLDFETRLAAAKAIRGGPGILVFSGNGFAWNRSDLEDFADFYHAGTHRQDDPFALMEQHYIDQAGIRILRNVDHFAFLKRPVEQARLAEFRSPVRGPRFGAPAVAALGRLGS